MNKIGTTFKPEERPAVVSELVSKIEQAHKTAETYSSIGYSGHAAGAAHQAKILSRTIERVMSGEPVMDYEMRAYEG